MSDEKKFDPKQNLKPWPKGVSGNPGGMTKLERELVKADKLTKLTIKTEIDRLLNLTMREVLDISKDANSSALTVKICNAIIDEPFSTLDKLFDRSAGKVKEEIEVSTPKPTVIRYSDGSEMVMGTEVDKDET